MSKQSSKRQKVAEQQLEILDELTEEQFTTFIKEYSQYIPYRKLARIVNTSKKLRDLFNYFADDSWWKNRVETDFYDYYIFIINEDNLTINESIIKWMQTRLKASETLWKKPWKLVYMSCYGIFNLINASKSPFKGNVIEIEKMKKIWSIPSYEEHLVFSRGGFLETGMSRKKEMWCWVTEQERMKNSYSLMNPKTIEFDTPLLEISAVLGGLIWYEQNTITITDKSGNIVVQKEAWWDQKHPKSSNMGNILVDSDDTIRKQQDLSSALKVNGTSTPSGSDYYAINGVDYVDVYQWPYTFVERFVIPMSTIPYDVLGPYNFDTTRFLPIFKNSLERSFEIYCETETLSLTGHIAPCSYGFLYHGWHEYLLYVPSGRHIEFRAFGFNQLKAFVKTVCGPFMLISEKEWISKVDLWTSMQEAMAEPFTLISDEHCHNCGFIAQYQCNSCESYFCNPECADEHFRDPVRPVACNHKTEEIA